MSYNEGYGGGGGGYQNNNQGGSGNQRYNSQGQGDNDNQRRGDVLGAALDSVCVSDDQVVRTLLHGDQGQGGYGNQGRQDRQDRQDRQAISDNQRRGDYDNRGNQSQGGYGDSGNQGYGGSGQGESNYRQGQGDHQVGRGDYGNQGNGGYGGSGPNLQDAADRAKQHGGSEDSSVYSSAMSFLTNQVQSGHLDNHQVDEDDLADAHRQAHDDQGRPQQVSDPKVAGKAGAMEAFKEFNSSSDKSQSPTDFMGRAMSLVSKFMGGNMAPQDKQTAVREAAKYAFMLYTKSKGGGAGGAAGGLASLLGGGGGGGSGGGLGNLMGLASKFL